MKTIYLIALALLPGAAACAETFSFRDKKIELVNEGEQLTVSPGCAAKKPCAATKNLAKLSWDTVLAKHPQTQGSSSYLCEEQLKGKVVMARNPAGDEVALCRFAKDDSLIDLGSLVYRARRNDKAASPKDSSPAKAAPADSAK